MATVWKQISEIKFGKKLKEKENERKKKQAKSIQVRHKGA